jgi:hypothetical protein
LIEGSVRCGESKVVVIPDLMPESVWGLTVPVPSSLPWMESSDAKLARAVEHFQTYNEAASQFASGVNHNLVLKHNPANDAKWLVFWESDQIPPMRLSAIVGDVLFNLRSTLDNLVCGLVVNVKEVVHQAASWKRIHGERRPRLACGRRWL